MKYFKKLNLQNTVTTDSGNAISFTPTGDGNGVLAVEETEAEIVAALDGYADQRVGGVVRISKEIYDAKLKKKASTPSRNPLNHLRVARQPDPFQKSQSPAVAAAGGDVKLPQVRDDLAPTFSQFRNQTRKLNQTK